MGDSWAGKRGRARRWREGEAKSPDESRPGGEGRRRAGGWHREGGLTWTVTRPPQHLAQEGSLVGGGQWDLPVTQLLPQAAVQQAQHQVVGGTGPLGDRDALRLCPTHAPLSTKSRLLPGAPARPRPARPLPQPPSRLLPPLLLRSPVDTRSRCSNSPGWRPARRGVHPPLASRRKNICSCWH